MKKILIVSIYPVPYRVDLYLEMKKYFDIDIFFEKDTGDGRANEYFKKYDWFYVLDGNVEAQKKFKNCLKNIKSYDLFLSYDYTVTPAVKAMLRCIKEKVPYAINCDGAVLIPNPVKDIIKKFFIKRADMYISSGKIASEYLKYYGASDDRIIFNTFTSLHDEDISCKLTGDAEKEQLRKELGISGKTVSLAVGRFIPLKYYDLLIRVWKNISPDNVLLIIGGGEEESNYRKLIEEYRLENVFLEGFKNKEVLSKYYKMADLFIHPTSYDVWGLVINEAMSFGLPVITTEKCVAGKELITNEENGFLVPVGNEESLLEKIILLLDNKEKRAEIGLNNLKVIAEYTVENSARLITDGINRKV